MLFFYADDGLTGIELYKVENGVASQIVDLNPGRLGSKAGQLTPCWTGRPW